MNPNSQNHSFKFLNCSLYCTEEEGETVDDLTKYIGSKKKDASSERIEEGHEEGHDAGEDCEVDQVTIGEIHNESRNDTERDSEVEGRLSLAMCCGASYSKRNVATLS